MEEQGQGSEEDINKLLVFGYECKIFRDDEKAQWVESEKHLIPCMSDPSVMVDRYDCRGALMDVRSHEARPKGSNHLNELNPLEQEVERICEEERFRDCQNEEYDDTEYQEEEFKRLQMAIGDGAGQDESGNNYSAIGYTYGTGSEATNPPNPPNPPDLQAMGPTRKKPSKDAPYVQPLGLYIPHDLVLPRTMKSHAIIQKTAKFIGSHGTQMEIILKTKQANNPQFNFLNYSDELNPYYKYLVTAIRTNAYKPQDVACQDDSSTDENDGSGDEPGSPEHNGSYLHPSLVNKPSADSTSLIPPSIYNYKPTAHSSYSMLVSRIQEVSYTAAVESPPPQAHYGHNQDLNTAFDLSYAQGGSDYEMSQGLGEQPTGTGTLMPPPDDLIIIEKMANYVIKNGPAFESLATTKGDPRFQFLDSTSPYHWYYVCCKEHYRVESSAVVASDKFVAYSDGLRKATAKEEERPDPKHKSSPSLLTTGKVRASNPVINTVPASTNVFDSPQKPPPPNHANAVTRMSTLPPELITKIEELRKRTLLKKLKESGSSEESMSTEVDTPGVVSGCEPAGPTALLAKKENVIKFSASISQKFRLEDDVSDRLELGFNNGGSPMLDDEASRLRKKERRRKAALFLERLKTTQGLQSEGSAGSTTNHNPEATPAPAGPLKESQPEATQPVSQLNRLLALKREAHQEDKGSGHEVLESMSVESKKHRSRKRAHQSSSTDESSAKDERRSSSKKKKSKHSKKKRKKDEKHHSHSHSKKSKKKRH